MITIRETLVVNAEGHAVVKLPPSIKPGPHRAVLHIEDEHAPSKSKAPKAGCLKGFRMAPDFDAPLEDLKECGSPRLPDCGAVFHTATAGA
jgi:hypothetical protein